MSIFFGFLGVIFIVNLLTMAIVSEAKEIYYDDGIYPNYHVRPSKNWINDPNGPFFDPLHQKYHLFFQYNPNGAQWGNMSWGHVISDDLVTWKELPVALYSDQDYDVGGVFSGSVTLTQNLEPILLYTCVDEKGTQLQCQATPKDRSDEELVEWVKSPDNPIIAQAPPLVRANEFRDPSSGWLEEGKWMTVYSALEVMMVGNKQRKVPTLPLYSSPSTLSSTIWEFKGNMMTGDPLPDMFAHYNEGETGRWECPDFYSMSFDQEMTDDGSQDLAKKESEEEEKKEVDVLKISKSGFWSDSYSLGHFNSDLGKFEVMGGRGDLPLDGGTYYASKSFIDPTHLQNQQNQDRRISWGWINEESSQYSYRGWAGSLSLPRLIEYDSSLQILRTPPIDEIKELRGEELYAIQDQRVESEVVLEGVSSYQFELEIFFDPTCPIQVKVRKSPQDEEMFTLISLSSSTLTIDKSKSGGSTPAITQTSYLSSSSSSSSFGHLRVFVDGSVVEVYANRGEAVISSRVYVHNKQNSLISIAPSSSCSSSSGGVQVHSLELFEMKSIWN